MKNLQLQNSEISMLIELLEGKYGKDTFNYYYLEQREKSKVNAIRQELERAYNEK